MGLNPYMKLKQKIVFTYMDKFPEAPSNQIAKILFRDNPTIFRSSEQARRIIRYYRGKSGALNLRKLKTKKYLKDV